MTVVALVHFAYKGTFWRPFPDALSDLSAAGGPSGPARDPHNPPTTASARSLLRLRLQVVYVLVCHIAWLLGILQSTNAQDRLRLEH